MNMRLLCNGEMKKQERKKKGRIDDIHERMLLLQKDDHKSKYASSVSNIRRPKVESVRLSLFSIGSNCNCF